MPTILAEAPREYSTGIRPAVEQDLSQILEIERLTFGQQWDYYQFKASLEDVFLVAVDASTGDIVGFIVACCCKVAMRGMILRIAVHPEHQGRGIGTQLIQAAFDKLKELNLGEVDLDVDIIKAGAIHLYKKLGFEVVEVFSPDIEEDESFYIMRRKLA
ncbi:MAG: N-acetyltransferase [Deltaproteobacteria bacterium]|nr:N-acetyltransferase [Deltaproteobacteria bacterium]